MVFLVQATMLSGSIMFLYCYFGEMATESYENFANSLYEGRWQDLKPELQKYIIVMIANAQRPLEYHGFNVAVLSLETFAKVDISICTVLFVDFHPFLFLLLQLIKAVFSYYMAFKTITEE